MRYLTTSIQPDLIIAVEDREADSLHADNIVVSELDSVEQEDGSLTPPQEFLDQQEKIKQDRIQAIKEAHDREVEGSVQIPREDGTMVGEPEKASEPQQASQDEPAGDSKSDPVSLTSGEQVSDDLVENDESAPQPESPGGKRVRRGTSAKSAE